MMKVHLYRPNETQSMCGIFPTENHGTFDIEHVTCKTCQGYYYTNSVWYETQLNRGVSGGVPIPNSSPPKWELDADYVREQLNECLQGINAQIEEVRSYAENAGIEITKLQSVTGEAMYAALLVNKADILRTMVLLERG